MGGITSFKSGMEKMGGITNFIRQKKEEKERGGAERAVEVAAPAVSPAVTSPEPKSNTDDQEKRRMKMLATASRGGLATKKLLGG